MGNKNGHFIDGVWVKPADADRLDVIDPSTEKVITAISLGGPDDVDAAVAAARRAFEDWRNLPPQSMRTGYVRKIKDIYARRAAEMAEVLSLEMGAPIDFARSAQVAAGGAWHIDGFLDAIETHEAETPLAPPGSSEMIVQDPVGVCGLITPWNWPMNQITLKVIPPALLVGCTVVLKPSEATPPFLPCCLRSFWKRLAAAWCFQSGQWGGRSRSWCPPAVSASGCRHDVLHRVHPRRCGRGGAGLCSNHETIHAGTWRQVAELDLCRL